MTKSNKNLCSRVLSAIEHTPWAITPTALDMIISIANRGYSDPALAASIRADYQPSFIEDKPASVAVIDVMGPIFARADMFAQISGACSLETLERRLDEALYDDEVSAIILQIDSPGGQVTGTHEFAHYLKEAGEIKPIVAYVSGMACSAAYWICSATSHIYADRTASIGSIGVVATWTDDSKARSNAGLVDYEIVSSQSPNKRLSPKSTEGKAELQKNIDGLADIFIEDVATFRRVSTDKVMSDFGQGSTFLAEQAVDLGMADEISNLRDVIASVSAANQTILTKNTGASSSMLKNQSYSAKSKANEDDLEKNPTSNEGDDKKNAKEIEDEKAKSKKAKANDDEEKDIDLDEDEEKEPAADEDEYDDKEEPKSRQKAIAAFANQHPALYQAIVIRGARRERQRIGAIDELGIVGHDKLVHEAKYINPKTVAGTSLLVMRSERKQREVMADNYQSDASFKVSTDISSAASTVTGNNLSTSEQAALREISAGAKAEIGVKK